jgi:hypothetical protein
MPCMQRDIAAMCGCKVCKIPWSFLAQGIGIYKGKMVKLNLRGREAPGNIRKGVPKWQSIIAMYTLPEIVRIRLGVHVTCVRRVTNKWTPALVM